MNVKQSIARMNLAAALACGAMMTVAVATGGAASVTLWDTGAPLAGTSVPQTRTGWKALPTDLLMLEEKPEKAISDPGYWGREHSFKGDAVVENQNLIAVFSAARGSVGIFAKGGTGQPVKFAEAVPLTQTAMRRVTVIRNAGDEVVLEVSYAGAGESAVFSFGRSEIVEMKPTGKLKGLRLVSPMQYGVLPAFTGDDLIYDPAAFPEAKSVAVPSENLFVGLQPGGDRMLVVTWPKGRQQIQLGLGGAADKRSIQSLDLQADGQSVFVASLSAPGIWHREELKAGFLEKDVALAWKRPFAAKWKTQLSEAGTRATYAFRHAKGTVWRGVPGSYDYPAWFDGDAAFLRLGKKVPPKGDALIYFLESRDTPLGITTPVDILKATLGRPMSEAIMDPAGRTLRTHHRRGGDGVHRACTCGCTEAIEAVFKAGEESGKKQFIAEAIDDMIFFVRCHVERIAEYQKFADETIKELKAKAKAAPDLKPYLESLEQIVQLIPQECEVQKENMKSLDHAAELAKQTMVLTTKSDPDNVKTYAALLKAWRGMGGAQDYVVAQCHTVARKLYQEAGYGCAELPKAVAIAEEIRARCRLVLRNADGYEIWSDY